MEKPQGIGHGRLIGVIGNIILMLCFFSVIHGDRWLDHDEGWIGLWGECFKINKTADSEDSGNNCTSIQIADAPGYLHATRALWIISIIMIVLAIAVANHKCEMPEDDIVRLTLTGIFLNMMVFVISWFAVWSYSENAEEDCHYPDCELAVHYYVAICTVYLILPVTLLLSLPLIWKRFHNSWCHKKAQKHLGVCRSVKVTEVIPAEAQTSTSSNSQSENPATGFVLDPETLEVDSNLNETQESRSRAASQLSDHWRANPPFLYDLPEYDLPEYSVAVNTQTLPNVPPSPPPSYLMVVTNQEDYAPPPYTEVAGAAGDASSPAANQGIFTIDVKESKEAWK